MDRGNGREIRMRFGLSIVYQRVQDFKEHYREMGSMVRDMRRLCKPYNPWKKVSQFGIKE